MDVVSLGVLVLVSFLCDGRIDPSSSWKAGWCWSATFESVGVGSKGHIQGLLTRPYHNVPLNLQRIYTELTDCFNNDSPTLCAAGLRAIVEGICAQQGVVDGPVEMPAKGGGTQMVRKDNLEGRIAGLQEKRVTYAP